MNRLKMLLVSLLLGLPLWAQEAAADNRLYIAVGDCTNPSQVPLSLHLTGSGIDVTALELYIALPDGATMQDGTLSTACGATHALVEGGTERGHYVSIASEGLAALPASGEPLCTWVCNFSQLPHGTHAVAVADLFAVGVTDGKVVCYTSAEHSCEFAIGDNGIDALETTASSGVLGIYNLQGQRMTAPQKGQVNIFNGRKVRL